MRITKLLLWLAVSGLVLGSIMTSRSAASLSAPQVLTPEGGERFGVPGLTFSVSPGWLDLEWEVDELQIQLNQDGLSLITIPGYSTLSEPNQAQLPLAAALVVIPKGANPSLEINKLDERLLTLNGPLAITEPQVLPGLLIGEQNGSHSIPPGRSADELASTWMPTQAITFERIGSVRGIELGRLVFYPVLPNGAIDEENLHLTSQVNARLNFNLSHPLPLNNENSVSDPIIDTLRFSVLNPEHIIPVEALSFDSLSTRDNELNDTQPVAYFEVSQPGLTAVTFADLVTAGLSPQDWNPAFLRLELAGEATGFEWDGNDDELFGPDERLLFYAEPRFNRYANFDVYTLFYDGLPGPRIQTRSASPEGVDSGLVWVEVLGEENHIYTPDCYCAPIPAGRDGERWVWEALHRPARPVATYPLQLPAVNPDHPAQLTVWMIGYTNVPANPDHLVEMTINGQSVGRMEWDGKKAVSQEFSLPAGLLNSGENYLSLALPGIPDVKVEGVWLDAFQIRYVRGTEAAGSRVIFYTDPAGGVQSELAYEIWLAEQSGVRVYDIQDAQNPIRLVNFETGPAGRVALAGQNKDVPGRFWVGGEGGLLKPNQVRRPIAGREDIVGADYLIISPSAFAPELEALLRLRQEQGLQTALMTLENIYEVYGGGRPDPLAIRRFLKNAYDTWQPRPVYLLLVGDGTYDPRGYLETSAETQLPPFLAMVDPWAGETASDNQYVTLDGDDNLPDMLVGRLPVNNVEETRLLVAKIVQYEREPEPGGWTGKATFVADNTDSAGNFANLAERLASGTASPPMPIERLYYQKSANPDPLRNDLLKGWDEGRLLMLYFGHASLHQWASEKFLHLEDIQNLENAGRLPLLLSFTCFTGAFQTAGLDALDERLLRHPNGGIIAAWSSTGLGVANGHLELAEGFFRTLFVEGQREIGQGALAGKLRLAAVRPANRDLIDTYTILGDPATRLNHTYTGGVFTGYLPVIHK